MTQLCNTYGTQTPPKKSFSIKWHTYGTLMARAIVSYITKFVAGKKLITKKLFFSNR